MEVTVTFVDDDMDGVPTTDELGPNGLEDPLDTDGDCIPDYLDQDDDNDNVLTSVEVRDGIINTDQDSETGDTLPDYLDDDDDGNSAAEIVDAQELLGDRSVEMFSWLPLIGDTLELCKSSI